MEAIHTLYVKNMVCQRCILTVGNILNALQISFVAVNLGSIKSLKKLEPGQHDAIDQALRFVGLEIIETKVNKMVEGIKHSLREYLDLGLDSQQYKLSAFISSRLNYDFGYISDLFSSIEGTTIERYFILHRIEKVKELLQYDQLSLSEISYRAGFSSVHHLSAQFKKITGVTPSQYKHSNAVERKPLDMVA